MKIIIVAMVLLIIIIAVVLKTRHNDYDPDKMIARNNIDRMKSRYK